MISANVTERRGDNISAFRTGLILGFGSGCPRNMPGKVGLVGAAVVLASVPVICFILAPIGGIVVTERIAFGGVAAVAFTGLRLGAGCGCPVVIKNAENYAVVVCNFDVCGCILIELAAGALIVGCVAGLGTGSVICFD